jgi:hypothetical protein
VTEFVEGETLRARLDRGTDTRRRSSGYRHAGGGCTGGGARARHCSP